MYLATARVQCPESHSSGKTWGSLVMFGRGEQRKGMTGE